MGAYAGSLLRINLNTGGVRKEAIDPVLQRAYLGSRGLGALMFFREVKAGVEPFAPENKLFIVTAPLNGTRSLSAPKFTATAKSPLTGFYGEASTSGGRFSVNLKENGFDAVVIEGKAQAPVYVLISDGEVSVRSASHLWGLPITEAEREIKKGGRHRNVALIGPAGENLVRFAGIRVERRSLGRCGLGAVMGSKNVKAIIVDEGSNTISEADGDEVARLVGAIRKRLKEHAFTGRIRPLYGTTHMLETMNAAGLLPTCNFQFGTFEHWRELSHIAFREKFRLRDGTCLRCPIGCEKVTLVREGPYAGATHTGPEWETIWAFGPQCGNRSLDSIVEANRLCNELGLDTISTGNLIGFLMECFQHGLVSEKDVGFPVHWGEHHKIIKLIKMIAYRQGFGDVLAEGVERLAEKVGGHRFAMHVKSMELPAYDPRGAWGFGLAYATSSRGGCHLRSFTVNKELSGYGGGGTSTDGKANLVFEDQNWRAVYESAGLCFTATVPLDTELIVCLVNAVTGHGYSEREFFEVGERIYNLERLLQTREGIGRKDDTLPARVFEEPLPDGPMKGNVLPKSAFEKMLDEYYDLRGWERETGVPGRERLRSLRLE
ncbi:MAG: aldehyde ferredoxin oxidoreductase family protein [Bacillota bacterium]